MAPCGRPCGRERGFSDRRVLPGRGEYHHDGHKAAASASRRRDAAAQRDCPLCLKKVTVGVMNRVEKLADGRRVPPKDAPVFHSLIPCRRSSRKR